MTKTKYPFEANAATTGTMVVVERAQGSSLLSILSNAFASTIARRDPSQAWFWTEEWQAGEREVDEHLRAGRYRDFDSMEDFLADLDNPLDPE